MSPNFLAYRLHNILINSPGHDWAGKSSYFDGDTRECLRKHLSLGSLPYLRFS